MYGFKLTKYDSIAVENHKFSKSNFPLMKLQIIYQQILESKRLKITTLSRRKSVPRWKNLPRKWSRHETTVLSTSYGIPPPRHGREKSQRTRRRDAARPWRVLGRPSRSRLFRASRFCRVEMPRTPMENCAVPNDADLFSRDTPLIKINFFFFNY